MMSTTRGCAGPGRQAGPAGRTAVARRRSAAAGVRVMPTPFHAGREPGRRGGTETAPSSAASPQGAGRLRGLACDGA